MHTQHQAPSSQKRPFDIADMLERIEDAVEDYPQELLFELFDRGFRTPFEILTAAIVSTRTLDEVTLPAITRLFARARTAGDVARLDVEELDDLIAPVTYHDAKAVQIHEIATTIARKYEGRLPCRERILLSFNGVGRKCTNLVLGIACGEPRIAVGSTVQRVVNRWGLVRAASVSGTERQLEEKLAKEYWIDIFRLLEPFGNHICTPVKPHCSTCPVLDYCRQVDVTSHR